MAEHGLHPGRRYVVVSGPPGSGKTTIAAPLAAELGLPLLAKDTIKDALMASLGVADLEESRRLGRAAVSALLAVARECSLGAVLESVWHRSAALEQLGLLAGSVVEVHCRTDRAVAYDRYRRRAGTRAAGHFDSIRTADEIWNDEVARPVAGDWPVIEVDTTEAADVEELAQRVRSAFA